MTIASWPRDPADEGRWPRAALPAPAAFTLTLLTGVLVLAAAVVGVFFGAHGLYEPGPTRPAFIGQDWAALVALPILIAAAVYASRGSMAARLCWMGLLVYVCYSYTFYLLGARFSVLFPVYIAIVSISMYSALALLFDTDLPSLIRHFHERPGTRVAGGFLIATSLFFAMLWGSLIVTRLAGGEPLDTVTRLVIAVDGVVLLPLLFFGGLWLWRREPLGYALGGLLLVKSTATFATLTASSIVVMRSGYPVDPLQTAAFAVGAVSAAVLLRAYLRSLD